MAYNDLPFNLEAEKAVLGAALLQNDALYNVISSLEEDDFYSTKHQKIYAAIKTLLKDRKNVDIVTLSEYLVNSKELDDIGGINYLQEILESPITFANLKFYIDIVNDQSVLRKMITTIRDIDHDFKTSDIKNPNDFILNAEEAFKTSIARRHISTFINMSEAIENVQYQINMNKDLAPDLETLTGITTGYPKLNALTQGFQKGEVTIIAGRPGMGKTAFALNLAYNAATKGNVPVAIFSLEMSSDLLVKRIIASVSSVNLKNINTCRFYGNQRPKVADAMNQIMNLPIYIDESPGIRLMDIVAKTRKLQATNKDLGLVIIDYLGLIQATSGKSSPDSRQEEVRKISLEIKNMARELKVPVVLLSQLSRDVEKRDTKRPMISDLRDSGSIEQDADVIFLLYRDDYYADQRKKAPGDKKPGQMSASDKFEVLKNQKKELMSDATLGGASYVEVHVAKNRNGSTGTVPLFFYKEWGKFEQPSQSWIDEMERLNQEISGE